MWLTLSKHFLLFLIHNSISSSIHLIDFQSRTILHWLIQQIPLEFNPPTRRPNLPQMRDSLIFIPRPFNLATKPGRSITRFKIRIILLYEQILMMTLVALWFIQHIACFLILRNRIHIIGGILVISTSNVLQGYFLFPRYLMHWV
jgi:hypothetical protein